MILIRFFLRFVLFVLILLGLALVLAYVFRAELTEQLIRTALARSGYHDTAFDVKGVSATQVQLENVTIGKTASNAPGISIDRVDASYTWREILKGQRIRTLTIGPGRIKASLDDKGVLSVPGIILSNSQSPSVERSAFDPANLPLDQIEILPIEIALVTPKGSADGVIKGRYHRASGGAITISMSTDSAGLPSISFGSSTMQTMLVLGSAGEISVEGGFTGQVLTPVGPIEDLTLRATGSGQSWIAMIDDGMSEQSIDLLIDLESSGFSLPDTQNPETTVVTTSLQSVDAMFGDWPTPNPITTLGLNGALSLSLADGTMRASLVEDRPFVLSTDAGDQLKVSASERGPLVHQDSDGLSFSFVTALATQWINLSGQMSGRRTGLEQIELDGVLSLPAQTLAIQGDEGKTVIKDLAIDFTGNQTGDRFFAQADFIGEISQIDRQALRVRGLRLNDRFALNFLPNAPVNAPKLSISGRRKNGSAACLDMRLLTILLGPEQLNASVDNAKLCANGQPLLTMSSLSPMRARFHANARAAGVRYNHGDASLTGIPPSLTMNGQWDNQTQMLSLSGDFSGGNAILNKTFELRDTSGSIRAQIVGDDLIAQAELNQIQIAQATNPTMINPVIARGELSYRDNQSVFTGTIETQSGVMLGSGTGQHNIKSGTGSLDASFADLVFLPDGLQPDQLLPGLKGIIANATGQVTGTAKFGWSAMEGQNDNGSSQMDISSGATIIAKDLTFAGPGRAVSSTGGLNTTMTFTDLLPAKSNGPQAITIGFVDLDAIRLENGTAKVSFPGDDTVSILSGEFPWFGGKIGAYDTVASLTGERVKTDLRASNINLAEFLSFLDIPGLSGEGEVAGTLPITIDNGKIRIENAVLRATRPGVIRFDSELTREISTSTRETEIAFDVLRNLTFETFEATISGALDGQLQIGLVFEGTNDVLIGKQRVPAPVIYRISVEGPLPNLISQSRRFTNFSLSASGQ